MSLDRLNKLSMILGGVFSLLTIVIAAMGLTIFMTPGSNERVLFYISALTASGVFSFIWVVVAKGRNIANKYSFIVFLVTNFLTSILITEIAVALLTGLVSGLP